MVEPNLERARTRRRRTMRGSDREPVTPAIIPGIQRKIPAYKVLEDAQLLLIEQNADAILAQTGMEIRGDEEALRLWREAGADVDGERIRFPPGLVRKIIQDNAPRVFTHHARNPARSVRIGEDHLVFAPFYGAPFVRDADEGRRYGTLADFEKLVKLTYATPWLHHSGGTVCEPVDIPVNKRHLDMVYAHIRWSEKPFLGSVITPERAEDSIAMARLVFGDEFTDQNCVIMANININSPLVLDGVVSQVMRTYARANQCNIVVPFILGGAMGPVSTVAGIAQSLAEAMAGIALCQLERPGAPVILGNFLSTMNLRSGAPTFGTPEPMLGSIIVGQLARRLGVPLRCSGGFTTSKLPDGQAMAESTNSMNAAVLCGAHYILHAAGWLEGALVMDYEKFMMDCDMLGGLHTFLKGFEFTEEAFALDAFEEVQPGGHFFGCRHTLNNYETAFYEAQLADSNSFEQWRDEGEHDVVHRANKAWKKALEDYQAPAIDEAVDEALNDFVNRRKMSMEDSWY
jgi:trimethylamine--corrinoid protein Co-methyltransferase